jgi:hypothetical protein
MAFTDEEKRKARRAQIILWSVMGGFIALLAILFVIFR